MISSFVTFLAGKNRAMRIRYESILTEPAKAIQAVEEFIDTDLADLKHMISENEPLKAGHLIAGNRLRLLPQIVLRKPDEEWQVKLFGRYKKIFWLIAGWLSRRYGYKY